MKLNLIDRLADSGLKVIEATSFVSPKWVPQVCEGCYVISIIVSDYLSLVPQMGDNRELMQRLKKRPGVSYPVLCPNMKGLETAIEAGVEEVAVFAAASDTFSKKNINCNVMESFERFKPVCEEARRHNIKVRGYVAALSELAHECWRLSRSPQIRILCPWLPL